MKSRGVYGFFHVFGHPARGLWVVQIFSMAYFPLISIDVVHKSIEFAKSFQRSHHTTCCMATCMCVFCSSLVICCQAMDHGMVVVLVCQEGCCCMPIYYFNKFNKNRDARAYSASCKGLQNMPWVCGTFQNSVALFKILWFEKKIVPTCSSTCSSTCSLHCYWESVSGYWESVSG